MVGKAASTFQRCLFSPTGFPCWKDWWYAHVYCNHIPFQTHATFCCQCFSVADLLDLIFKQNCTNLPSTVSHTPTPVRAVLTSDNINNVCQGSLSDVSQRGWETVNTVCRKSFWWGAPFTYADTNVIMGAKNAKTANNFPQVGLDLRVCC